MKNLAAVSGVLATLQWGSASIVEVLWTITGILGVYFTWSNFRDTLGYIEALDVMNGHNLKTQTQMRIIAMGHYRNELFRMSVFAVIIAIGVIAMLTPPSTPGKPVTYNGLIITVGLFVISGIMVIASVLDHRQRTLLLNYIEPEKEKVSIRT